MKKQFFRVKQLADQTFLRADKSEVLNNVELKNANNKVEYLGKTLAEISKKLPECNGNEQQDKAEKRKKKYNEYALGEIMVTAACSASNEQESSSKCLLFTEILKECGAVEQNLAEDAASHEAQIENLVSLPINNILEKDIPNIIKYKKNLNKHILDKDAATSRYKSANQKETLKEDMDEADIKVDQSRDQLATEMFSLLRKENEISSYILQLLKMQRAHHESALKNLERIIPDLEQKIGDSCIKPIFGVELQEHLRVTGRKIALPLELCVVALTEIGISEEGLFRVVGGVSRVKRLKLSIDSGSFIAPLIQEYRDVHVLASTLKSYLRELPDPLLTKSLHEVWMKSMQCPKEQQLKNIQHIISKLPQENRENLAYLIQFLSKLSKHPENKMTASNIAIVIAPNLLWANQEEMSLHMQNCTLLNRIIELFILDVDVLFPDDMTKYEKFTKSELLGEHDDFTRPEVQGLKNNHHYEEHIDTASPKQPSRKNKKPAAPAPPPITHVNNRQDIEFAHASYPSGSSTLSRSHKIRHSDNTPKIKPVEIINNEEITSFRRNSLVIDEKIQYNKIEEPNEALVNVSDEEKYSTVSIQLSRSKPVQQTIAQLTHLDLPVVTNNLQNSIDSNVNKPIAAPRVSLIPDLIPTVQPDIMSQSLNSSINIDGDIIQLRKLSKEEIVDKPGKPAIPIRPASLRTVAPRTILDPEIHKTQCSVYNTPNKQQPSIVNIHRIVGHDNQMAEKEKFLGHQPDKEKVPAHRIALENKFNDINSNCDKLHKPDVPTKPPHMKSNERLNMEPSAERFNGNSKTSHVRTRSDGHIIDISLDGHSPSLLQTPPSPRSLNKPSQPPPPPPTNVKHKAEPETTAF